MLDITGNAQTSFTAQSFTTGTGTDLVAPSWVSATCSGATNVPDNTTVVVTFSKAMDPATFDPNNSFYLYDTATGKGVLATITFNTGLRRRRCNRRRCFPPQRRTTWRFPTKLPYMTWPGTN